MAFLKPTESGPAVSAWIYLAGKMLVGALILVAAMAPVEAFSPLPWDMSHHYLGALGFRDAFSQGSAAIFSEAFFKGDLYPPGHSIILGAWLSLLGESPAAWAMFFLATVWSVILAFWWGARGWQTPMAFAAAVALYLLAPLLVSLSATFMIDIPASVVALLSVLSFGRLENCRFSRGHALALSLLLVTLLTKHNIGLPLVPTALVLAILRWRKGQRRAGLSLVAIALTGAGLWALFLTVQNHGWENFLSFARNRSNSADMTGWQRAAWYFDVYRQSFTASPWLGGGGLVLALTGVWKGRPEVTRGAAIYTGLTFLALLQHDYLLGRNLVPLALMLALLGGEGAQVLWVEVVSRKPRARRAGALALLFLLLVSLVKEMPRLRTDVAHYYRGTGFLSPVEGVLASRFRQCETCCVVGTFNEMSAGWVKILWRRVHGGRSGLRVELPYPGQKGRKGRDATWTEGYTQALANWDRAHKYGTILTLELDESSPFRSEDYRRWGQWKENYVRALKESPQWEQLKSVSFGEPGLTIGIYHRVAGEDSSP